MKIICSSMETPLGLTYLYTWQGSLVGLMAGSRYFDSHRQRLQKRSGMEIEDSPAPTPLAMEAGGQINRYFSGELKEFSLPVKLFASQFENSVLQELMQVPYGSTVSYAMLAQSLGTRAVRAVGSAVGRNPVPIIVPCHRVIRTGGALGEFSAGSGTETKIGLLNLENRYK